MNLIRYAIIFFIVITFILTLAIYPKIPDLVVSHWNAAGQADGYLSKFWGLFLIPLIMTGIAALLAVLPRIDPYKKNYEKFRNYYDGFILLFVFFMLAVQVQVILWNTGYQISPNLTFPVLIGTLFIYIGLLLGHAEQNWFVGIRTPWTLSSETVWKKTHRIGGLLFIIAGVISFFGIFAGTYALWFVLLPVLAVAVLTVVYSYFEYQKEITSP
ncbi:MAG: SdpI family protein [Methanoregula sp.]|nr:SdpI family protein [Methanoregula sp.]